MEADDAYFSKTKFMNDYSNFFQDELKELGQLNPRRLNITGRFNQKNFESNKRFTSTEYFRRCVDEGK